MTYWGAYSSKMVGNDVVVCNHLLNRCPPQSDTLYLFIKSSGGSGMVSLRLIHLLRQHYQRIIAMVPLNCASAATMLALGADEIHMGPISYLTAVDTSITHALSPVDNDDDLVSVSQNELDRVLRLWKGESEQKENPYAKLYKHIHPLVFGAVDRASSLSIKLTQEILAYHLSDAEKAQAISKHLNSNYPSHNYPITAKAAVELGLNIQYLQPEVNELLLELNRLYSEMAQRAYTDYDEYKYHDNHIQSIIERQGEQVYYQIDKDQVYRKEERRWVPMHDRSSWRRAWLEGKTIRERNFYIR